MEALWSTAHLVACIHPGWQALHGRTQVIASWRAILQNPDSPEIECSDAKALVIGDCAFVTCTENMEGNQLVATNIFARDGEDWKMVHHQAAPFSRSAPSSAGAPEDSLN